MKFPKIVICTPTYSGKNYCWDKFIEQYNNLSYPNKDLFVVDNSPDKANYNKLKRSWIRCKYVNPKGKSVKQVLAESHELLRQYCASNGVDFMLHWESDVFNNDPDIVQKLLMAKKAVVGVVYPIRTGAERELNLMTADEDSNILHPHRFSLPMGNMQSGFIDGTVKSCFSASLGCTLIHSSIFKKLRFRFFKENDMLPDMVFSHDLWETGTPFFVDTSIYCTHDNREWLPE